MLDAVSANKLSGSIPPEVSLLTSMRFFIIESCCSPSIPKWNATGFVALRGKLPSDFSKLQNLKIFDVRNNLLTGTVSYYCTDKEPF
jgi:hypothetical protein